MEANTSTLTVIGILKWLFPSLIGSALAVWYKRHDVDWQKKELAEKVFYSFVGIACIIVGVVIAIGVGNALIVRLHVTEYWYCFLIYLLFGLSSLKILDAVVKNTDDIISLIFNGIKDIIRNLIDKFLNK